MKQSLIIDFILDPNDEVHYYFEILNSGGEYPSIFLCKVVSLECYNSDAITIKKVSISMNPKYADWLKYNSGTYNISEYQRNTMLYHMYQNRQWFVSFEHTDGVEYYIKELDYHLKQLKEE